MINIMCFPKRLKELREKRGLSQEGLAKQLNIPRSSITQYETGQNDRLPRQQRLTEIADFFGVSVDYLIGRTSTSELNPNELKFIDDLDKLTLEEIISIYSPLLDGKPATKEEIEGAITFIRMLRSQKF